MEHTSTYLTKEIKLSCYQDKLFKSDLLFDDHMLVWFISGETLKIAEAINILYTINPKTDHVLANFGAPGKIDLLGFMQRNFIFNMSLEKLGYLSGRSLSTFNRGFKKLFNTTPQKWLTNQRLELAYYKLAEKKKKPTEEYLGVGFEDRSHFSFIFKKIRDIPK